MPTLTGDLIIEAGTIIDGVASAPLEDRTILIQGGRIKGIYSRLDAPVVNGARIVNAAGKYLIPGLMNANVHLCFAITLERLARHFGDYRELITEAAQIARRAVHSRVLTKSAGGHRT